MGGDLLTAGKCGSLYGTGYNRQILCFTRFDFGRKQNLMFSFNPDTMMCSCCEAKVFYKRGHLGRSEPRTIILSDQNFPASLPATSKGGHQCLKIIRLEFASLCELNNIFLALLDICPMSASVPMPRSYLPYAEDCTPSSTAASTASPVHSSCVRHARILSWCAPPPSWSAG